MSAPVRNEELANYRVLVSKVDEICATVTAAFAEQIQCHAGCSGCCRELTLFPVEAAALLVALAALPPQHREALDASGTRDSDSCPLLVDDLCLVYESRPIICRTHGLPLLLKADGESRIDFCPENFRETKTLPGTAIINLELLNQALVAINALFVDRTDNTRLKSGQRQSMAAVITLWKGLPDDPA